MKKVLLSVHPKWCELIFNGKKTIEVRKNIPKLEPPFEVLVYCTKHKGGKKIINEVLNNVYCSGAVIGSFICDKIYSFITYGAGAACIDSDFNQIPPERVIKETCLTEQQIMDYLEKGIGNYEGVRLAHKPNRSCLISRRSYLNFIYLVNGTRKVKDAPKIAHCLTTMELLTKWTIFVKVKDLLFARPKVFVMWRSTK